VSIEYTDPEGVTGVKVTDVPVSGQTVTGYGGKVPTAHMIEYLGVWRRVYAMVYGNGGTPYIKVKGANVVLDIDTQHRVREAD
jgi:UDP-N-acetylmuramoylalanine-D-glutamate ligase